MKNLFTFIFLFFMTVFGLAQGTVTFSNSSSDLVSPPDRLLRYNSLASIFNPAYTVGTPVFSNSTPGLRAQLYYGVSDASEGSLTAVTTAPAAFKTSTSANVGTWFTVANVALGNFAPGTTVNLQVRVWDISLASDYNAALAMGPNYYGMVGESLIFQYTIPTSPTAPPSAYIMANFQGFSVGAISLSPSPEPKTMALLLMGCGIFFVSAKARRRGGAVERKN